MEDTLRQAIGPGALTGLQARLSSHSASLKSLGSWPEMEIMEIIFPLQVTKESQGHPGRSLSVPVSDPGDLTSQHGLDMAHPGAPPEVLRACSQLCAPWTTNATKAQSTDYSEFSLHPSRLNLALWEPEVKGPSLTPDTGARAVCQAPQ